MTVFGDKLLLVSGDGRFFKVDLVRLRAQSDALPRIDLGAEALAKSRRYKSFELPPRVHDILVDRQDVYVSFDQYNSQTDASTSRSPSSLPTASAGSACTGR